MQSLRPDGYTLDDICDVCHLYIVARDGVWQHYYGDPMRFHPERDALHAPVPSTNPDDPDPWVWLSFVDPDDGHNLGVCIVPGRNTLDACRFAWAMGINPGGEVAGFTLPPGTVHHLDPGLLNRLLTKEECIATGLTGA